ncbi:MAG: thiamine phosphate synthase [Thermoanaerobaculia bacterium]|nr:thiamine phosphate synthase [Thermoanaerobaculia bacterium]
MNPPRLLAVSDLANLRVALEDWLAELVACGVDGLWLRERTLPDQQLLAVAERCRRVLPPSVRLILSARVDLALLAAADGVHLPASGLPARPLRALAERHGRSLLLGRSTHSLEEVRAAREEGLDYVSFGPVFPTPSKAEYGPPRGLAELGRAVALGLPVIALGGIAAEHGAVLRQAGVAGLAAQRAFSSAASAVPLIRAFTGLSAADDSEGVVQSPDLWSPR